MSWNDLPQLESELKTALDEFNWPKAAEICDELVKRLKTEPDLFPEASAKIFMSSLRKKRRYGLMTQVAEAILQSGLRTPLVRRHYAQALIDQGILAAGDMVLQTIVLETGAQGEGLEARGLTGRIYKQLYVNNNDAKSDRNRANLERALSEYQFVYRLDPTKYLWHGMNVVALSARARRDSLPLAGLPDPVDLAQAILATIEQRELESPDLLPAFDIATALEAHVALGNDTDAVLTASRYISSPDADAFEINSTIRQLTEVWQLSENEPPGNLLLPICKAGYLRKAGAAEISSPETVKAEAKTAGEAIGGLENIFGDDRMVPLIWYKKGLDQCNSVARIERRSGKPHGTGWLVHASDFFPNRHGVLLLTNNHVISQSPNPYAIFPEDCQVNFQAVGQVLQVEDDVVWQSSYLDLDATFLKLRDQPKAAPLTLHKRKVEMVEPTPRLYIIGYPRGRDLELSLQDNHLVACNERVLHYRTPTEPGSSGSPVFEPEDWRVVALHHKGNEKMQRIDGKEGDYQANEGISILALQNETNRV